MIGIADRYELEVEELYELNGLTAASLLTIGQRLLLGVSTILKQAKLAGLPRYFTFTEDGRIVYQIRPGRHPHRHRRQI